MSFNNLILTGCEIFASCLLIYGFINEDKVIRWERRQARKIKKAILKLIMFLEG